MNQTLKQLVETTGEIEELIRSGNDDEARRKLAAAFKKKPPRSVLPQLAALSRRCDLPLLGVKILNPVVRPTGRKLSFPTARELVEYAACLLKIGAAEEGEQILEALKGSEQPERHLYRAFAKMAAWDYRSAIPLLETYLASSALSDYQRVVGKLNLASAWVVEARHDDSEKLVAELLQIAAHEGYGRIRANCLELRAQIAIQRRCWNEAEGHLREAAKILEGSSARELFFIRKWKAIIDVLGRGANVKALHPVEAEARERFHWETVRQCDFYRCLATRDEAGMRNLLFGTPFPAARERFLQAWGPITSGVHHVWNLSAGSEPRPLLDPVAGTWKEKNFKAGTLPHRLLVALCHDFYHPQRLAELHRRVYPDEHFNPWSSPLRVHQALHALRDLMRRLKIPLKVHEAGAVYSLVAKGPAAVKVPYRWPKANLHTEVLMGKLLARFAGQPFSSSAAAGELGLPPRTVQRWLTEAVNEGAVERIGRGKNVSYRISTPSRAGTAGR